MSLLHCDLRVPSICEHQLTMLHGERPIMTTCAPTHAGRLSLVESCMLGLKLDSEYLIGIQGYDSVGSTLKSRRT